MDVAAGKHLRSIEIAAALIRGFVADKCLASYRADEMVRTSVQRQLQVIGEAIAGISSIDKGLANALPEAQKFLNLSEVSNDPFCEIDAETSWVLVTTFLDPLAEKATELIELAGTDGAQVG